MTTETNENILNTIIIQYLDSLDDDILSLNLTCKGIEQMPSLTRFKKLQKLHCSGNYLTSLPNLPKTLKELYCHQNRLIYLPTLPQNLEVLDCYHNDLLYLPDLPKTLKELYCYQNPLTDLPSLPKNLIELYYDEPLFTKYIKFYSLK
jgi:E3 ubiquitin-protein ligase SspH2